MGTKDTSKNDEMIETKSKRGIFFSQPQNLFLLTALLITILPFFFWGETVVIHFDKPRVFIAGDVIIYIAVVFLIIGWTIYKFTSKLLLTKYLSWLHVGITLVILYFFLLTSSWFLKSNASNELQAHMIESLMSNKERDLKVTSPLSIVFIIGQLTYLVNLTSGLILKRRELKNSSTI